MPQSKSPNETSLPEREVALRQLLRRQLRAFIFVLVRLVAWGLLLTLIKPLWVGRLWLDNLLFGLGALLCGIPLFKDISRNWGWRIALGVTYLNANRLEDAEALLAPLTGIQALLFDPKQIGSQALTTLQQKKRGTQEQ
ncbi:hypothetical protein [Armatimonas sp.]|uniref:hypothetical protein n=1 Tax=Armatimonas sp. TaxID=1872638 RepID=UPI00286BA4C9|nr:hypothetical protein [Armatimonas sp.]